MPHSSPTRRLVVDMFRRQRRDAALCTAFWSLHQVCEALVPVAIGLVIDQAVGTGSTTAMSNGRIVELGTPDELVAAGGAYAELWSAWHR